MKKFEKVYLDLENKIRTGVYPIGTRIPTEQALAVEHDASRETIRKAQKLLVENGFLQKRQGCGAVVIDFTRFSFPVSGLVSYKELQEKNNIDSRTVVIKNEIIPAPDFLVGQSGVTADEKFVYLVRARYFNNEVMIVDEDYIRCSIVETIPNAIAVDSIYEYFEQTLGLHISYANKDVIAEKASDIEAPLMNLRPMDYVINVKSHVYLEDTRFFQYSVSHHRLEKFRFSEFARRKPKMV